MQYSVVVCEKVLALNYEYSALFVENNNTFHSAYIEAHIERLFGWHIETYTCIPLLNSMYAIQGARIYVNAPVCLQK